MLFKMALKNIRKSIRDYAIYFFTLIIGVSVFYVFNAIEDQTAYMIVSNDTRRMASILGTVISSLSVFVAVVLGLLIVFASRFLMKRRNREFATYMLLGMSKGKIAVIMFFETMMIGAISLVVGMILGIGLSQLMSALVVRLFRADMNAFRFIVSSGAIIKTIIYFALIYLMVIVFDTVIVGKTRLINLINASKKNEKIKLKNPALCTVIFIAAAVVLGIAYHMVLKPEHGIAELQISTLIIAIVLGAVSTFFIFWSVSGLLLRLLMSMRKLYFKKLNSFTVRQLSSVVNTMVFSMSIICLLLFFTISGFSAAFSLRNTLNKNLKKYCRNDVDIRVGTAEDVGMIMDGRSLGLSDDEYGQYYEPDYLLIDYYGSVDPDFIEGKTPYEIWEEAGNGRDEGLDKAAMCMEMINKHDYFGRHEQNFAQIFENYSIVSIYNAPGFCIRDSLGDSFEKLSAEHPDAQFRDTDYMDIITVSDYNKMAEIKNYKKKELGDDEYFILANTPEILKYYEEALKNETQVTIYGKTLRPKYEKCVFGTMMNESGAYNLGVLVVPDHCIEGAGVKAILRGKILSGTYNKKSGKSAEELDREIDVLVGESDPELVTDPEMLLSEGWYVIAFLNAIYQDSIGFGAIATFLSLYLGIVFLITSAVILALKALSDAADSYERYEMLRRIGADEKDINGSIFRQQGIFFILPMLLAVFHSIFGIQFINKTLVIFGEYHILGSIVFTALLIGLIYGGYFIITYLYSRQIIKGRR